jgi:hypothetical protein
MPPPPPFESRHRSPDRGEWTYLTYDVDRPCVVCEEYLHSGQAAGYVKGQLMHARCYREGGESGRHSAA